MRAVWQRDPLSVALGVAALVLALAASTPLPSWLGAVVAVPLALALPGWTLQRAIGLRWRDPIRVFAYAVGVSLAVAVATAVVLAGLGALSAPLWAAVLAAVSIVAASAAVARAPERGEPAAVRPDRRRPSARAVAPPLGLAVLAIVLLGAAVGLARTPLPVPDDRGYTTLSIAPSAAGDREVRVTVASEEAETEGFTLRTIISGRDPVDLPIEIAPGESIEETVAVPAGGGTLYVRLLKPTDEGDVVYRRVRVNLPLTSPAPPAD